MKFLFGCDPEVFVRKNGEFHSAHGLIKGDKKNPFPVNNGAVQVDGMALEFNINPVETEEEFLFNVISVLDTLKSMVPEYEIAPVPAAEFDIAHLKAQPREALELGCDPDFNAWMGGTPNPRPNGDRPMRTASGHIHIGWRDGGEMDDDHLGMANAIVKQLDFFLALPSLSYDPDTRRREMYGKAGACRYKSYGVEYRVLSNAWLNSPELIKWTVRASKNAIARLMKGEFLYNEHDIQDIVNTSNVKEAIRLCHKYDIEIPNYAQAA